MKSILLNYLKSFWSPEKVVLLSLFLFTFLIKNLHPFYFILCRGGNARPDLISCISQNQIENILAPLASNSPQILIFLGFLLLLPLPTLQSWAKYIASWSIPLGILIYLSGIPNEPGSGSMFSSAFNAASMLSIAVMLWLWLLAAFVVYQIFRAIRSHFNQK